ncbi:MAG: hypothetical protein IPM69_10880 [Ignavibacteria bacterium]|nr:hypothetical protein [Ignavibacteria bacterium]
MIPAIQAYSRAAGIQPTSTVRPDKAQTNKFSAEIVKNTSASQSATASFTPHNVISFSGKCSASGEACSIQSHRTTCRRRCGKRQFVRWSWLIEKF